MQINQNSITFALRMKMTMTLLVLCGLSCRTVAQTDTIADRTHHLEGVTVTETRRQQVVTSTVPQHLIDRQDMLVMGVTDIADALHRMSGITLRDYGGAGGMKTVSVRGFGSKHTGVSYDGVMLSECQSGEIDLSRYSLDNVDHLSLIIGDNDDIFIPARQATTPATLNIQTLKVPTDNLYPHLTTQLKVGSFGYVSPFLRYEQNLSERFAFSAVGEYTYAENDYPYTIQNVTETVSDRRQNSRMNSGHGELNFIYNNKVDRLTGKVYYYDNKRQLPGQVHYYTTLSGEELHDRNFFSQLMYQTRWGECWALRTHAKFNWVESVFRDHLYPGGVNDASYWQRESYASAALLYAPRRNWAFDYSADYAYNNLNGSSARTIVGRPYRHTVLQSATAKYTGHRLTVMGRLLCSIYINDSKEGNSARNMRRLSPSLSLSYLLSEAVPLRIRASYKNIFRSPTFNESYYYHYGSYDLKPESTDQFNVGLTWEKPSKEKNGTELQSTLDIYYNNVRDMIVAVPKTMFVWSCVNVGKVQVFGLDATIRATHRFCDDMKLTATTNYSYQRVQNMVSPESPHYKKQIAYMPEHTASASVGFEHPWVNTSLHAVAVSQRWANNEHYDGTSIDGYCDVGLTLWREFSFGPHQLEGRFDLKNLFNTQYEIVSRYPMPGRSFQLSINYNI